MIDRWKQEKTNDDDDDDDDEEIIIYMGRGKQILNSILTVVVVIKFYLPYNHPYLGIGKYVQHC